MNNNEKKNELNIDLFCETLSRILSRKYEGWDIVVEAELKDKAE
ncbi:MAG: hypothetical protein ACLULK_01735 [Anaerovoracaceae bacterium]